MRESNIAEHFSQEETVHFPPQGQHAEPYRAVPVSPLDKTEVETGCACLPMPRAPFPPPIPNALLEQMFSGQNVTQDLFLKKVSCRRFQEELKEAINKLGFLTLEHVATLNENSSQTIFSSDSPLAEDGRPASDVKQVKTIDLTKGWQFSPVNFPKKSQPKEGEIKGPDAGVEIVREFARQQTDGKSSSGSAVYLPFLYAVFTSVTFVTIGNIDTTPRMFGSLICFYWLLCAAM